MYFVNDCNGCLWNCVGIEIGVTATVREAIYARYNAL